MGAAVAAGGHFAVIGPAQADVVGGIAMPAGGEADLSAFQAQQRAAELATPPAPANGPAAPSSAPPPPSSASSPSSAPSSEAPPSSAETEPETEAPPISRKNQPPPETTHAGQVVALVNQERGRAGCTAVTVDGRLTKAAQGHSDDMSRRNYFSHTTPEGVTFGQRIRAAGHPSPGAENIAKGSTTAAQTMDMWMKSDGHRRNILNCSLRSIGVGVASKGWYWTQNFGY